MGNLHAKTADCECDTKVWRKVMSRRSARKHALELLFQMGFLEAQEHIQTKEVFFAQQEEPITEEEKAYILSMVEGTQQHLEEIDAWINRFAKGWDTQRMNRVDVTILRLAVYELKYSQEAPVGVIINEAVELAKKFSSDEAPAFINGVLGKIASA